MIDYRAIRLLATSAAIVACLLAQVVLGAVTVDGSLSDWGISLDANKHLVFSGGVVNGASHPGNTGSITNFLGSGSRLHYHTEDSNDAAQDGGVLGPHSGGQNYDGEFLGVMVVGNKLHVAIATGQRPDNQLQRFSPGDLRIETSNGTFGIEFGGGAGNASVSNGVFALGTQGTSYDLNSSGYTQSVTNYATNRTTGSVWAADVPGDWILDTITGTVPTQLNHQTLSLSDKAGTVDAFVFNFASLLGEHSFIELTLDLGLMLGSSSDVFLQSVFWAPSCDNDELRVDLGEEAPGFSEAPEPASILVWVGIGSLAALCFGRRRHFFVAV